MKQVPYQIISRFGEDNISDNGDDELIYKCPFCVDIKGSPDTKGHLYVNTHKLTYCCHRCGSKGSVKGYIPHNKRYGSSIELDNNRLIKELSFVESSIHDEYPYKISYKSVLMSPPAKKYLNDRGFDDSTIEYYDMRVPATVSDKLYGRIIIPNKVVNRIQCDMYCARTYIDQDPKYKNPFGENKSRIVFNLFRIDKGSPVIICEGALSAIAAGRKGIASYGKYVSNYQISQILAKDPSAIYVSLDPDAKSESDDLCNRILKVSPSTPVYQVIMPYGHDPASLTKREYLKCLSEAKRINRLYEGMIEIKELIQTTSLY